MWRGLPAFRGDARFSTWAHRIAANAAFAAMRRRRDVPIDITMYDVADDAPGFDSRLADQDAIHRAIATLDPVFLEALVLREYGELSYEEIAEHQRIGVQTVKSRLSRARATVRANLVDQT
jgi:RNA polymerase sigma-70 factor (ECF subfamily)